MNLKSHSRERAPVPSGSTLKTLEEKTMPTTEMKGKCVFIGGLVLLCFGIGCARMETGSPVSPAEEPEVASAKTSGLCPQTRGTPPAPDPFAEMKNPLPASAENLEAGSQLFHQDARPIPCEICHGFKGNGFGVIFQRMKPYPRDFTCYQTMNDVTDGQMFWIIKNGSHGTRMKAFKDLTDEQVWQLVHYVRSFGK